MDAIRTLLARLIGNHWIIGLGFFCYGVFGVFQPVAAAGMFFFFLMAMGVALLVYAWEEGAFDKQKADIGKTIESARDRIGL